MPEKPKNEMILAALLLNRESPKKATPYQVVVGVSDEDLVLQEESEVPEIMLIACVAMDEM